jgi:hypothetical protein
MRPVSDLGAAKIEEQRVNGESQPHGGPEDRDEDGDRTEEDRDLVATASKRLAKDVRLSFDGKGSNSIRSFGRMRLENPSQRRELTVGPGGLEPPTVRL